MLTTDILHIKNELKEWMESAKDKETSLYLFTKKARKPTLLSNCFAVLTLELFNEVDSIGQETKETLIGFIKACQLEETGHFIDPLLRKEHLFRSNTHSWDYLTMQSTMFSINALDAFGEKPRHRINFVDMYKDVDFLIKWLQERNWKNPWLESNNIMFIGCFLLYEYLQTKEMRILEVIDQMLNWHDKAQDSHTGFWGTDKGASLPNAMAGAFHIYYFYYYLKRPIQYSDKIVDSTLSLQHEDGLFVSKGGGGACEDLDAIDILTKFTALTDYKKESIKQILLKSLKTLANGQNRDGGYGWKINGHGNFITDLMRRREICHYSSWKLMPYDIHKSDMWSCWFRYLAISLIVSTYPDEFGTDFNFKFRRLPGLGWHGV